MIGRGSTWPSYPAGIPAAAVADSSHVRQSGTTWGNIEREIVDGREAVVRDSAREGGDVGGGNCPSAVIARSRPGDRDLLAGTKAQGGVGLNVNRPRSTVLGDVVNSDQVRYVESDPDRTVVRKACQLGGSNGDRRVIRRGRITGKQRRSLHVEDAGELRSGFPGSDVSEPRQWSKREHICLGAVGHRRVTVAARDLLALDSAVHIRARHQISVSPGCQRRGSGVRWLRIVVVQVRRMSNGGGGTLNSKRLCARGHCREANEKNWQPNLVRLPHGCAASFRNLAGRTQISAAPERPATFRHRSERNHARGRRTALPGALNLDISS